MSDLHCEFSAEDFTATAFTSSSGRVIRVTGFGLCPSAGWELSLVSTNPGVVPHPESLWLELRERAPKGRGRVLVDTGVEAIIEDDRATEIVVRFSWREPFAIPVVEFDRFGDRVADAARQPAAASVTGF
ncbi:hypothetical protein [Agromyces aureus]|uniref:Uncharacterized protein n=1 Tax=Agromyces aureus TaxID=453304 RepID=A0A191WIL3_9MICO|nr:hypothetical protein [Agromyces aureus]ANJ28155.1 hypothetical protein ATC03_17030 [Agromyces aureus]